MTRDPALKESDPEIASLIEQEVRRQHAKLRMIPSENYASRAVQEAMGSPLVCVAWLANRMGELGVTLEAGELVLSGSLVPLEPVVPGDVMTMHIPGIGSATARFV